MALEICCPKVVSSFSFRDEIKHIIFITINNNYSFVQPKVRNQKTDHK